MLLQALVERSKADELAGTSLPAFYARQPVAYRLDLDADGRPVSFQAVSDPANPKRGLEMTIPCVNRTGSAPKALPVDRGDFVFGIAAVKATDSPQQVEHKRERASRAHEAYRSLVADVVRDTEDPGFGSIKRFLAEHLGELTIPDDFDPSRFIAIYVSGHFPVADLSIQRWWATRNLGGSSDKSEHHDRHCAVCGAAAEPVESISTAIRGLTDIGGYAMMGMVTANDDVYERHGMKRASGASICVTCGERSHQALNALIADPAKSRRLGNTKILWWSTEECGDILAALVQGDSDESLGPYIDSILRGSAAAVPDSARFYAITIGANVNRVVVRDWIDTSLAETLGHISYWLHAVAVTDRSGQKLRHPGIFSLLAGLAPPGSGSVLTRISPLIADKVVRSAFTGLPLPDSLLLQCLQRIRAEQGGMTAPRAALLKAWITTRHPKEAPMSSINASSSDVAYRCGRLLAVLDRAAYSATNVSLVDRSYAAASTAPAATFAQLLKLHRAHIAKLRRDKPGLAASVQASVEEVMSGVAGIPRTFAPTEQARFALGMYHQQAHERALRGAAETARALKKDEAVTPDTHDETSAGHEMFTNEEEKDDDRD